LGLWRNTFLAMINDLYRIKVKLAVLETSGFSQVLADVMEELSSPIVGEEDVKNMIRKLKWKYLEEKVKLEREHTKTYTQLKIGE
jgi:hypothetical protein